MIKLSDALSPDDLARLAVRTVKVGDVYEITMTEANGIKPKSGDSSRDKYFIVLGFLPRAEEQTCNNIDGWEIQRALQTGLQ